ncbi:MAG: oxidoreductase [Cellvibrionaceae bacterium]|nr:oxidoreductase [Cellvibrionaceae bacterium]|tara:strand:+ start:109 stop:609 length:501 start_codon:yes stop_codon:yes gene_type:complete
MDKLLQLDQGKSGWSVDRSIEFDERSYLSADQNSPSASDSKVWLFTLSQWQLARHKLDLTGIHCGLLLDADADLSDIAEDLPRFGVVVIDFPHFNDGRGFSLGAQLREHYQFRGEMRAAGYLLVDQLNYLLRCGFDSFSFRNNVDPETAVSALSDFSDSYQPSVAV